ncbi:lysostaphin resistance A-like protein [Chloroflexota bacterium]
MEEKQYKQHSVAKSILLHLIPGVPVIAGLFIFALPVFSRILGIAIELHVLVGLTLSILITIVPIQLGILFYEGKKLNGKLSLKGVIGYTEKSSIKAYLIYIPILLVYSIFLFVVISPMLNPAIVDALFAWYPQEFNLQNAMANPEVLTGYQGVYLLIVLFIITNGILGPLVEELYFRGYLLPRMDSYAKKWAPALNVILFSLYHYFSPWENPIRIIALLPLGYLVWKKRNIRFSIWVHILLNTGSGIMMLAQILSL